MKWRSRSTVASRIKPLVDAALGPDLPIGVRCWDGSRLGPNDPPFTLVIAHRRALRRLLWAPNELGFARAHVSGDIDFEGDLFAGLDELLGILGPPPEPPAEESRLAGRRHSKDRDASAITHHYDVGNDFYRIVLGESMTYSCAYWAQPPSAEFALDDAQFAKCDLIARKLGLRPGMRVLDVGCGWGTFARHAAREYDVHVVGITLSPEQARVATKRMAEAGVADLVEIRVQDYRDVDDGPFDAVASIGIAEHVGAACLPGYAAHLSSLLAPQGRLLNHAIARRPGPRTEPSRTSFIDRYVFPDGQLEPLATTIEALEGAGLEVRDVESLREHYALTLRAWVANLERGWDGAVEQSSAARARIWRLYMAGSALAFDANRIGVNQVLAVRPGPAGSSGVPRTRDQLLTRG